MAAAAGPQVLSPSSDDTYLTVLLVGPTGVGKSTTGNKLLERAPAELDRWNSLHFGLLKPECDDDPPRNMVEKTKSKGFETGDSANSITTKLEMLSNRACAIRVLDMPGFGDSREKPDKDFQLARKILAVQEELDIKFHKALFFLQKGGLARADAYSQSQLKHLYDHFGMDIFRIMVVVITPPKRYVLPENEIKEMIKENEEIFHEALAKVLGGDYQRLAYKPKFVYIPPNATSKTIWDDIGLLPAGDGMKLSFNESRCYKCGKGLQVSGLKDTVNIDEIPEVKTKFRITKPSHQYIHQGNKSEFYYPQEDPNIPADTCHVAFKPKFSAIQRFAGGILHIITFGIIYLIEKKRDIRSIPTFFNGIEVCINCNQSPGSMACLQVGHDFHFKTEDGQTLIIPVQHRTYKQELQAIQITD